MMLVRALESELSGATEEHALVALVAPRGLGSTSLVQKVASQIDPEYSYVDLAEKNTFESLIENPQGYLRLQARSSLIVVDHLTPATMEIGQELFSALMQLTEESSKHRFLVVSSLSKKLLRRRCGADTALFKFFELTALRYYEVSQRHYGMPLENLWMYGGYPASYTAADEQESYSWRRALAQRCMERDVPAHLVAPSGQKHLNGETLMRLWTMVTHWQGLPWEVETISESLEESPAAVNYYLGMFQELLLVRALPALKSQRRSHRAPIYYVRDSGLGHALMSLVSFRDINLAFNRTRMWEGFVIDQVLTTVPLLCGIKAHYYCHNNNRSRVPLVLDLPSGERWGVITHDASVVELYSYFHDGCRDIKVDRKFVITMGDKSYIKPEETLCTCVKDFLILLRDHLQFRELSTETLLRRLMDSGESSQSY